MKRTYRFPLHPTKEQETILFLWLRLCCFLYNAALQERIGAHRASKNSAKEKTKGLSYYDQCKSLTTVRRENPEYDELPAWILRSALDRLDKGFQAFFSRCASGARSPGFPRFRSWKRYTSFSFPLPYFKDGMLRIPVLGLVKINLFREIPPWARVKQAHIVKTAKGWVACIVCDIGEAPPKVAVQKMVGIDVGLLQLAAFSDGSPAVENPRFFRQAEKKIADLQRVVARRVNGSKSRNKAKDRLAEAYARVVNRRKDFAHKVSKRIVQTYDLIVLEDLKITNMVKLRSFAKSILDASWSMLTSFISYKAEEAGKTVLRVPAAGTSQECPQCGAIRKKLLSERIHQCLCCGLVLDRDEAAARVILQRGLSLWRSAGNGGRIETACYDAA